MELVNNSPSHNYGPPTRALHSGKKDCPAGNLLCSSGVDASNSNILQQLFDDMRQIEDTLDSIEIPARGRCKVFMAKYGYDPFKQSPNDNPDAELAFNAGDYIMVFDDIDEDGYFIGELMDGRRGYVPSNWLDRLTGEDLFEFQATVLYNKHSNGLVAGSLTTTGAVVGGSGVGVGSNDETDSATYPPEFYDAILADTMNHSNFQHILLPEDYHRMNDYVDLDDVNEVDDECLSDYERAEAEQMRRAVPPPQRLIIERQLNKSILISWLHPQVTKGTIVSYQVYVDGVLKSTVPSGDRTKALLEGVDSTIPHRISVRAIDLHGRHSNDAGCTIVIGQKIPFAPSCVKASHITSDSALISWLPCNSNFHHVVAVNSVEVQTVRPGVYKYLINGLSANTLYRVWVRAKPGKILSVDEKNPKKLESLTTCVDFRTMPKSLPDPPVNVQVEAGPQRRTLLVTWLPLTLNEFGSSNGCAVTGYAVFAGHKKLADIDSPTGDHALLDLSDLESLHKKSVTVRTKSGENLSQDSMPCQIPDEYLKTNLTSNHSGTVHSQSVTMRGDVSTLHHTGGRHQRYQQQQQQHQQHHGQRLSDTSLTNTQRQHSPHRSAQLSRQMVTNQVGRYGHSSSAIQTSRGRSMTRSLQNLESDLDSRRSSIPAIEITRETASNSDLVNPTESYSEEEFEHSMRFRGARRKPAGSAAKGLSSTARYRARQSHSVNGVQGRHYSGRQVMTAQSQRGSAPLDRDIRFFVALFDYDPSTMSPNPNAASEELAFKEGSIIKVYGDRGADGFYKGELENQPGRIGYVPYNVITELTDQSRLYLLYEKHSATQNLMPQQRPNQVIGQQPTGPYGPIDTMDAQFATMQQQAQPMQQQPPVGMQPQQQPQQPTQQVQQQQQQQLQQQQQATASSGGVKRMIALYDYDPQENSPNADTESEIPFKVGDAIYVYGKMDADGFYMGEVERTKQRGLVPSNFLREDPITQIKPAQLMQQQQQPYVTNNANASGQFGPNTYDQMGGVAGYQPQQGTNPQMRTNIRGPIPNQQPQMPLQKPMQQANINRPNTLSLGQQGSAQMLANQVPGVGDWSKRQPVQGANMPFGPQAGVVGTMQDQSGYGMYGGVNNPQQPQQQQQPMQQQTGMGNQFGPSNMMQGQQSQQMTMQQQHQLQQQPQQQQQQQVGGMLNNLISSGKQIMGAASTPRMPNQPGQFGVGPSMMGPTNNEFVNPMNTAQMRAGGLIGDGNSNFVGLNRGNIMQQGDNINEIQSQFALGGGLIQQHNQPQQQQQQLQQQQQQQHLNNSMGGQGPNIGFNRGPATMGTGSQGMGGDPAGNILNTVKNMFKL